MLTNRLSLRHATAACLVNRGIDSVEEAEPFLGPKLSALAPPTDLSELDRAADRVATAVFGQERIGVFGDYMWTVSRAPLLSPFFSGIFVLKPKPKLRIASPDTVSVSMR
jgi:hypothetical protein